MARSKSKKPQRPRRTTVPPKSKTPAPKPAPPTTPAAPAAPELSVVPTPPSNDEVAAPETLAPEAAVKRTRRGYGDIRIMTVCTNEHDFGQTFEFFDDTVHPKIKDAEAALEKIETHDGDKFMIVRVVDTFTIDVKTVTTKTLRKG